MSHTLHLGDVEVDEAKLAGLCRQYHVRELSLFGSAARGGMRRTSDQSSVEFPTSSLKIRLAYELPGSNGPGAHFGGPYPGHHLCSIVRLLVTEKTSWTPRAFVYAKVLSILEATTPSRVIRPFSTMM